ncbi:MAG TPA: DivIVA domain-containing protein [Propionibacteriaceae bacterium]|nr:DivIVA domain-containing protein [Propionibacteriaceae bacterium]
MEWFIAVIVIAALGAAALVAAGGLGHMDGDPVRDVFRQDLPPAGRRLDPDDIHSLRFGVTLRGYAMDQVDDVLERLAREIAERDAVITNLSTAAESGAGAPTPGSTPDHAAERSVGDGAGDNDAIEVASPAPHSEPYPTAPAGGLGAR